MKESKEPPISIKESIKINERIYFLEHKPKDVPPSLENIWQKRE